MIDTDEIEEGEKIAYSNTENLLKDREKAPAGNVLGKLDPAVIEACKLAALREAREETMNLFQLKRKDLIESHAVLYKTYVCFNVLLEHVDQDEEEEEERDKVMAAADPPPPPPFAFNELNKQLPHDESSPSALKRRFHRRNRGKFYPGLVNTIDFHNNYDLLRRRVSTPACWLEMSGYQRFFLSDLLNADIEEVAAMKRYHNDYLPCLDGDGEQRLIWARTVRVLKLVIERQLFKSLPIVRVKKELQKDRDFTNGTVSFMSVS